MAYAGIAAPIPLGQMGLVTDVAPPDVPMGALVEAKNITLHAGRVQKAPGSRAFNSTALPAGIIAVHDWHPQTAVQRLVAACSNGHLYIDNGVGSSSFSTVVLNTTALIGLDPNCQFISAGGETSGRDKKLFFISRGQNQLQVLTGNGTTFSAVSSPATDWAAGNYPRCGALHRNHLFVFAGQNAYGSDTGDHENFTSGDFLIQPVFPGEGGDIIAAYVFKGRLFCFKEDSFGYWLDDSNPDSDLWVWKKLTSNFGVSSTNSICEALNDMIACNDTGTLTSFAASERFGDVDAGDLLQSLGVEEYLREHSSKAGLSVQHILYYPEKKQLYATYRSAYYTTNDMILVIDLNKQQPRITFWEKGVIQCLGLRKDSLNIRRPMYGSSDGRVYFMDIENRREGASAYEGAFQIPHTDFRWLDAGLAGKNKLFDWLQVTYVPEGDWNLSCDYYIDGKYIDTITFPMVQYTGTLLDTTELDTNRLAQRNTESSTRPLSGSGRVISFRFYNSGLNESFQVCSIKVGFRPSGEQAQKTE